MRPGTARPAHLQGEATDKPSACRNRSPLKFFALVLGLSVPFWLLGAAADLQLMPGLSVSALMVLFERSGSRFNIEVQSDATFLVLSGASIDGPVVGMTSRNGA
jgi:hypothetical protein